MFQGEFFQFARQYYHIFTLLIFAERILKTIMVSPTVLIARDNSAEMAQFGALLRGGLAAEKYQLLKMNVTSKAKQAVLAELPSLRSPTVSSLADNSFAIEVIVKKEELAELIVKLLQLGATGIIAQEVEIVL